MSKFNSIRDAARRSIQRFGYEIHRRDPLPIGRCPFRDVATIFAAEDEIVAFDVGANAGQTTEKLLEIRRPRVFVHAFEPGPANFDALRVNVGNESRASLNQCALGNEPGHLELHEYELSTLNSILPPGPDLPNRPVKSNVVEVKTVDDYSQDHAIDRIHLLKIDTQGFDLQVLRGAEGMLHKNGIDAVLIEVNYVRMYADQASPGEIMDFLIAFGMRPACFYPVHLHQGQGGWNDVLFIHKARNLARVGVGTAGNN